MPDSAGPGGATPLEGLLDAARNTHAEAVVTALRQLREAFEDDSPPGKCVGVVRQFYVLSAKQGNVLFEAWERHGAEKAASRVVVYVLAAAAALFRASRLSIHTPSKSLTAGTGLPSKAGKAFEEMKRANLQDARAMAKTVLQSRPGAVLAILSARGADRAILAMLGLLTEVAQLGGFLAREIMTQIDWSARALTMLIQRRGVKAKPLAKGPGGGKKDAAGVENAEAPIRNSPKPPNPPPSALEVV